MNLSSTLTGLFAYAPSVGMTGTIQFIFSGDERLWVDIGEQITVAHGYNCDADTEIDIPTTDFLAILAGSANVEQLFTMGNIKIRGDLGLATLLPQIIDRARYSKGNAAPKVEMNARYPARVRFSETVSSEQALSLSIERIACENLSVDKFRQHYLPTGIPVIIADALRNWPLFTMSREESLAHFSNLNGITRHGDYVSNTFSTKRDFRTIAMAEFVASLEGQHDASTGAPAVYMGNNILPAPLFDTIRFPPYFDRDRFNAPRIWIGPAGTLTPLHRDDSDNLFAQVWGQKRFTLAAPHHRAALGTWSTSPQGGLDGCDFNPDAPDYEQYPQARQVPFLRFTLEAGDLLFLPEGWFHQVQSISTSLSVNFWINSGRGW